MKSPLFYLNYCVCQWFGFRVCRIMEEEKQMGWGFLWNIKPLTGWDTPYEFWF